VERFIKLFFDFGWINDSLIYFSLVKSILDILFNFFGKGSLDKLRHELAVYPVTICNSEEVGSSVFSKMWQDKEWVLVLLVWVLWRITSLGCEGKLSYTVIKLFGCLARLHRWILSRSGNFFADRCSHVHALRSLWFRHIIFFAGWLLHKLAISRNFTVVQGVDCRSVRILNFTKCIFTLWSSFTLTWHSWSRWLSPSVVALAVTNSCFITLLRCQGS